MRRRVACPICNRVLEVPPEVSDNVLLCPNCRAIVPWPTSSDSHPAAVTGITKQPTAGPPHGTPLVPDARVRMTPPSYSKHDDPSGDIPRYGPAWVFGIVLCVLTLLVLLGLLCFGVLGVPLALDSARSGDVLVIICCTLAASVTLALIGGVAAVGLTRLPDQPGVTSFPRTLVRYLGNAGTIGLAVLSLVLACVIFVAGTCASNLL